MAGITEQALDSLNGANAEEPNPA